MYNELILRASINSGVRHLFSCMGTKRASSHQILKIFNERADRFLFDQSLLPKQEWFSVKEQVKIPES